MPTRVSIRSGRADSWPAPPHKNRNAVRPACFVVLYTYASAPGPALLLGALSMSPATAAVVHAETTCLIGTTAAALPTHKPCNPKAGQVGVESRHKLAADALLRRSVAMQTIRGVSRYFFACASRRVSASSFFCAACCFARERSRPLPSIRLSWVYHAGSVGSAGKPWRHDASFCATA